MSGKAIENRFERGENVSWIGTWKRRVILVVLALAVIPVLVPMGLAGIGKWLVVEDPLDHAQAIVVLSGNLPFRAMEAASIYREGWAKEVWLTWGESPAKERVFHRLGISVIGEEAYSRAVLEKLGVPSQAIRRLGDPAQNTVDEVNLIAGELRKTGQDRVIIVTSKPHSRRVRSIWQALVGQSGKAFIRYAKDDPYDSDRWWRSSEDAQSVSREVFGLLNVWLGFPIGGNRPSSQKRR